MLTLAVSWSPAATLSHPSQISGAADKFGSGDTLQAGSGPSLSGQYQLHLGPLAAAGTEALQLQDLVIAIATHAKKEANVFAGRPQRLVSTPAYLACTNFCHTHTTSSLC